MPVVQIMFEVFRDYGTEECEHLIAADYKYEPGEPAGLYSPGCPDRCIPENIRLAKTQKPLIEDAETMEQLREALEDAALERELVGNKEDTAYERAYALGLT